MRIVIEKRETVSRSARMLIPIISFIFSLAFGAVMLALSGVNPWVTFAAMAKGALGNGYAVGETLVKAIPLMLTGLGVAIAFRMLFWNIGAEGQLAMGGIAAAGVALFIADRIPSWSVIPLIVLAGMVAGALWAAIPAALRAYLGVNETITTLMMNYIAIYFVEWLIHGPWKGPSARGFAYSDTFPHAAWLPTIPGTRIHWLTLILGLVLAVLLDMEIKGKSVFRTIFLLPLSFSYVASASMWTWMFSPEGGAINTILRSVGLGWLSQPWITSESQSIMCIAIAYIWQFSGFATLVYYAGITAVPPEVREAAKIDGASTFQLYWRVIVPLQKPATLTVLAMLLMYTLRAFDLVWLMTGGGPGTSSEVLSTFMFRTTFNRNHFGYGAAIGIFMFVLSLGIIFPFFKKLRGGSYD